MARTGPRPALTSTLRFAIVLSFMRILVVSDLHGNWPALAAIREPHDICLCLGDLVDYGPFPRECVRWAMEHAQHAIRGNHDHGVAQGVEVNGDAGYRYLTRVTRPLAWSALDASERRFLLQLPLTKRITIEGRRILLVHGTPRDPLDEYVLDDPVMWKRRLEGVDADLVLVGHTHMQFTLNLNGVHLINPGSVGQPRDGDPRAAYAVIDFQTSKIELRRIDYPVEETVAAIRAADLPERAKQLAEHSLRCGKLPTIAARTGIEREPVAPSHGARPEVVELSSNSSGTPTQGADPSPNEFVA